VVAVCSPPISCRIGGTITGITKHTAQPCDPGVHGRPGDVQKARDLGGSVVDQQYCHLAVGRAKRGQNAFKIDAQLNRGDSIRSGDAMIFETLNIMIRASAP
jgi:hypothetical protein